LSSYRYAHRGHNWFLGTGRRKDPSRAYFCARLGKFTVNKRTVEDYFPNFAWKHDATEPLKFTNMAEQVDVIVTAHVAALADRLVPSVWVCRAPLRSSIPNCGLRYAPNGFFDPRLRMKERKKYGPEGRAQALPVYEALVCFTGFVAPAFLKRALQQAPSRFTGTRSRPASCRQEGCSAAIL